jgi:hypothetical protein
MFGGGLKKCCDVSRNVEGSRAEAAQLLRILLVLISAERELGAVQGSVLGKCYANM